VALAAGAAGAPAAAAAPAATPAATAAKTAAPEAAAPEAAEGQDAGTTRRNFFRLDIFDVQVVFTVDEIGGKRASSAPVRGSLGDVSAGGLRLSADVDAGNMPDWPVGRGVLGHLQFALLEDEPAFDLPGRLVRRVETTSGFELAFAWNDPPQPEIDRLVHSLYQLEVRRRASMPDGRRDKGGKRPAKSTPARGGARGRPPLLLGAAIGLAAAVAIFETVSGAAIAPVLGIAAVVCAAAYLLTTA
jgi:hypothetical protein